MTYRELAAKISRFTANQLDADVTIYNREIDEYLPATGVTFTREETCDVLDDNSPVINISEHKIG